MKHLPLIVFLLLTLPVRGLTDQENKMLDKVQEFYQSVGMQEKATWLATERSQGRISFGTFSKDESTTTAITDTSTKHILINTTYAQSFDYQTYVDLGLTLAHERVHQGQSSLAVIAGKCTQVAGFGNAPEREGWAAGLKLGRSVVLELRNQLAKATSAQDKIILGKRLEKAAGSWSVLLNDWKKHESKYESFPANTFKAQDGFSISIDEMLAESKEATKMGKTSSTLANQTVSNYSGKYRGEHVGDAGGPFNFDIRSDYSIAGNLSGRHGKDVYQGTLSGSVDRDGNISGKLWGTAKSGSTLEKFSGTWSGRITPSGAKGSWSAHHKWVDASGDWTVRKL